MGKQDWPFILCVDHGYVAPIIERLEYVKPSLGVGTTGFVIALSWLSSVIAGHTKKVTVNAIMLSAYCIGNSTGPLMWQAQYKPR